MTVSNLTDLMAKIHAPLDKTLFRVLSLGLGFFHVAMLMWDPHAYSEAIGGFNALISPLLIWALCSSMVFGLSFKPQRWYWQLLFSPYISLGILSYLTVIYVL